MRHRMFAVSALVLIVPVSVKAGVAVEQIEAFEVDSGDNANAPTRYATVNFDGASTVTLQAGQLGGYFAGITFHALGGTSSTDSEHAYTVGENFYGDNSVAYPLVTDVYAAEDTMFIGTTVNPQSTIGIAAAPGTFSSGVAVVNNSYVYTTGSSSSDLDLQRRLDFMIAQSDVTFVAAAVSSSGTTSYETPWSSFNALAVAGGTQTFSITGSQGKQHADLFVSGEASFSSAIVSGYAAALYGTAQTSGQSDALHGEVIRSLLMAGADKTSYVAQTANNLSVSEGAGIADYSASLAILNGGENPLLTASGGAVTGTPSGDQRGWSEGTVAANSEDVVLFHADNPLTTLTASLNWDVSQAQPSAGKINTNTSAMLFADLGLEVRSVTLSNGKYVIGPSMADVTLHSDASGDNVQYLYSTNALPAGDYAFVITGDSSLSPLVGFSYAFTGTFPDDFEAAAGGSWATASNWAGGVPNAAAAQASLAGGTGVALATLTLDGDKTIGQLYLSGATHYTIAAGSGGTLTINDTGDPVVNPLISVATGSHTISAPTSLTGGVTTSIAAGGALDISGAITGSGGLTKTGAGPLTLDGSDNFGNLTISAGTVTLTSAATLTSGTISVTAGTTLDLAASTGSTVTAHSLGAAIVLATGARVDVAEPTALTSRQLIITPNVTFTGSMNNWTGQLELGMNDLDLSSGSLAAVTNEIIQGTAAGATTGITSADVAATETSHLTALGAIVNNDGAGHTLYSSGSALGEFDGASPGANDVLVKFTYVGDANLDGTVSSADLTLIDTGFTDHLTGWYNGDFNYDGVVDGSDFTLIDDAFPVSVQPASELATSSAAVPEPAGIISGLTPATLFYMARRRRRRMANS